MNYPQQADGYQNRATRIYPESVTPRRIESGVQFRHRLWEQSRTPIEDSEITTLRGLNSSLRQQAAGKDRQGVDTEKIFSVFKKGSSGFTVKEYSPQSSHGSTVREASRQASSTAFSSEPVEESPRAEFFIAADPELSRRTRPQRLRGSISEFFFTKKIISERRSICIYNV